MADVKKSQAGVLGGRTTAERLGSAHYAKIGKQGGTTTVARHGSEHFQKIGRQGGLRVRDLCALGRAQEAQKE